MSAISSYPFVLLLVAAAALAVAYLALLAVRRLHREVAVLRDELAAQRGELAEAVGEAVTAAASAATDAVAGAAAGLVPAARSAEQTEEIRAAVARALAEERERELAEARAFWAAHEAREAREAADAQGYDGMGLPGLDGLYGAPEGPPADGEGPGSAAYLDLPEFEVLPLLPRQADHFTGDQDPAAPPAQRRHPSDPDFAPSPVVADPEQTMARLHELAEARIPLADVRPGPLGTLDLYVFTDGTTLCLTPGHSETADRLTAALERGEAPVLVGGSGISGAFALTFIYGTESVFVLADRVVASL